MSSTFGAPSRRSPFGRPLRIVASVTALIVAVGLALASTGAAQAAGSSLISDTFTTNSVTSPYYTVGGSGPAGGADVGTNIACLTAAGGTTGTPTSCVNGANDANGSGTLRLTDNDNTGNETGYLLFNHALPTRGGLDISFNQFQWGSSAAASLADGISFFLTDGQYALNSVGPVGGSLGYNAKSIAGAAYLPSTPVTNGLPHALLGIGLDGYGNFPTETNDPTCPAIPGYTIPGRGTKIQSAISVRGPAGDVTSNTGSLSGYCLLAAPAVVTNLESTATTRPAGTPVRITVDPPSYPNPKVNIYWNGATTPTVTVAEPTALTSSPTFKFGFAASTGAKYANHEISQLSVTTIVPLSPGLTVTSPASLAAVPAGMTSTVPFTVSLDPEDGPAVSPVTATVSLNSGAFAGTPVGVGSSGTKWACVAPAAGSTSTTCTYTPDSTDIPGSTLPVLNVPVTLASSGSVVATLSIPAAGNANGATSSATTVPFAPVANPASGSGLADATAPATIAVTPTPPATTNSATLTYAIATQPTNGTASVSGTTLDYVPNPGFSGFDSYTYTATADGQTSGPAAVSITVYPKNTATSTTTSAGTPVDVALAPLSAGTSLTYAVANPTHGTVTVAGSTATFTPTAGFSGTATYQYQVTDSSGLVSGYKTVTVTVTPTTADTTATGTLDATGHATVVTNAPTSTTSTPATYSITPGQTFTGGTPSIDSTTGKVTWVANQGVSGQFSVGFTYTAPGGTATATAHITVRPYASGASASTPVNTPVTLAAPTGQGTNLTWRITTQPTHDTTTPATINPSTGAVTYTPDHNYSGPDSIGITGNDGVSDTVEVQDLVTVVPVVQNVSATATASNTPVGTSIPASGTGTNLTYNVGTITDSRIQSATVSGTSIVITPKPGVSGNLSVPYTATDGTSTSPAATATLVVSPVATAQTYTFDAGTTLNSAMPTPVGTGPFTYTLVSGFPAAAGASTSGGQIHSTPTHSGTYQSTYRLTDGDGLTSAIQTITLHVIPVGTTDTVTTPNTTAIGVDLSTLAPDASTFTVTQPSVTGSGSVTLTGHTATFTPNAGFSGTTTFTYTPTDADGNVGAAQTVTVNVTPTVSNVSASAGLDAGGNAIVSAPAPTYTGLGTPSYAITGGPSKGSATIDPVSGVVTYTAATSQPGTYTVTYGATGTGGTATGTATFTIYAYASTVTADTTVGTAVTLPTPVARGTGPYVWTFATLPSHAAPPPNAPSIVTSTGVVDYTPVAGYSGNDQFQLKETDANNNVYYVTAIVHVHPVVTPVTGSGTSTEAPGTPPAITTTLAGTGTGLTYQVVTPIPAGIASATITGGTISVVPQNGVSGIFVINYTATDSAGNVSASSTDTVTIAPVAPAGTITVPSGGSGSATLPTPVGTGPFTRQIGGALPTGITSATFDPTTGVLTVVAASTFSGSATIDYTVTDAAGVMSAPASIAVTVSPSIAPIPTATLTAVPTGSNPPTATATAVASGAGPFTYALSSTPPASTGTATIDPATGALTFTPAAGFSGAVSIPITATDAHGTQVAATWQVNVLPVADPRPSGGSSTGLAGVSQQYTPPAPIGTGPFTYHLASVPSASKGTTTIDPTTGVITFVPKRGFAGEVSAEYFVVDASGLQSAVATATFTVLPSDAALATTGANVAWSIGTGLLALVVGFLLVIAGLRRRRGES